MKLNAVQALLRHIGLTPHTWWWASDLEEVWNTWEYAPDLAFLLRKLGYAPAQHLLWCLGDKSPTLRDRMEKELQWDTPESAHNAVSKLAEAVGHGTVIAILQMHCPLSEVAPKLVPFMETLPAQQYDAPTWRQTMGD